MLTRGRATRLPAVMLLGLMAFAGSGCTYMRHRGEDAMDMMDVGVTVSKDFGFAFYYDFVPIIPIGYGHVDGHFAGLGGGRFGWMRHYEHSVGLILWGREEVGWGQFDGEDPQSLRFQRTGLLGVAEGPAPGPDYMISCPHYLHVGWLGLVATPRYLQIVDFALGWTALDICGDDGREIGQWP